MAFHTFGPGLALDKITARGLSTVTARVEDADTGEPLQAYTMDDPATSTQLTTNRYGYFPEFRAPDTARRIRLTFGNLALDQIAHEVVEAASTAVEDVDAFTDLYAQQVAAQEQQVGNVSDRLESVEVLAGLAPGDTSDATVKSHIINPTSQTSAALSAAIDDQSGVKLGAEVVSGTLTYAELQATANRAAANGRTLYAAGTLTTDQTLVITSDTEMGALTYNYTGLGVAVRIGTSATSLFRRKGTLPRVIQSAIAGAGTWTDSKIGIQLVNNDSCIWTVPHVKNFGVGVEEVGDNRGHAYNTITIGHLENNKINHRYRALGTGWANQNTHIGGRFGQNSGEGVAVAGCRHVQLVAADANAINTNTWIGSSFEGNTPEFHADVSGTANMFLNCRWEASAGPKVRWADNAVNNQILYGYVTGLIAQTHGVGATRNHVMGATQMILPTSLGTLFESSAGNDGVADAVMGAGGVAAGTNPATGYAVKRTANSTHMKRPTDAFDRVRIDHVNGRVYLGDGTIEPTTYIGVAGASTLRIEAATSATSPAAGGAGALPATPAGYLSVYIAGAVRKIPYY